MVHGRPNRTVKTKELAWLPCWFAQSHVGERSDKNPSGEPGKPELKTVSFILQCSGQPGILNGTRLDERQKPQAPCWRRAAEGQPVAGQSQRILKQLRTLSGCWRVLMLMALVGGDAAQEAVGSYLERRARSSENSPRSTPSRTN